MKRALAVALLLTACTAEEPTPTTTSAVEAKPTTPPPPTAQQARDLIANSPELGEHEFTNAGWTAAIAATSMSAPIRDEARQLAEAGWISLDRAGDISLNAKSREDKRFLLRANGILDVIPLAKKEMGDVTALRTNPDGTVAADFKWKWIPNDVGTSFRIGGVHDRFAAENKSAATLMWDGTNWIVLKIDS